MKSKSWKKLFLPEIKTRSEKNIILVGRKTIVRPKTIEDLKNDYRWRIDPELSDLDATVPINLTYEQFQRISINEIEKPSPWSVKFSIDNKKNLHIGNCMFYDINRWNNSCEYGIMIGNKKYWNSGYGADATLNTLYYIFNQTDITKIYLHTLTENIRAQNSFKKAGFNFKKIVKKGSHEFHFMEIDKSDWQKNKDLHKPEVIVVKEQD